MAIDSEIIGYLVFGGLIGALLVTLWPYFSKKSKFEQEIEAIREKPESERTEAEKHQLTITPQPFWAEYKFRFFFGLLVGVGTAMAAVQTSIGNLEINTTPWQAVFAGLTASGFFASLADKIRAS